MKSDNCSLPPPATLVDNDDPFKRNRKPNSTVKNKNIKSSCQSSKSRRPKRNNKSRKGGGSKNHDNDINENLLPESINQDQDQPQISSSAKDPDTDMNTDDLQVLRWSSPSDFVSIHGEEAMVKIMLPRGKRERGMMRNYSFRLKEVKHALKSADGMTLKQALSLRRLHIKNFNPFIAMSRLGLGEDENILKSATLFEESVQEFLDQNAVQYWTEKEQRERAKESGREGLSGTPDFLLRQPVMLRKVRGKGDSMLEERKINWVECKMFYGASSIPQGGRGAIGSLVSKMSTYVDLFGEGAIVFMNGCGDSLASKLRDVGVIVLDCAGTVELGRVLEHQKTWCSSRDGQILN
ncbi:MAG: hypothetical protein SGBAC_000575 [Bacillariaceae sp.]